MCLWVTDLKRCDSSSFSSLSPASSSFSCLSHKLFFSTQISLFCEVCVRPSLSRATLLRARARAHQLPRDSGGGITQLHLAPLQG